MRKKTVTALNNIMKGITYNKWTMINIREARAKMVIKVNIRIK